VWLVGAGVGGDLVEQGKVVCHLDLFMPLMTLVCFELENCRPVR
jgi:hypothetical protein